MINKKKLQPEKVKKFVCPKCGELQVKIYPWSNMSFNGTVPICKKCVNKGVANPPPKNRVGRERYPF